MATDKQKLMALGIEKLADALLERAAFDPATRALIERLIGTAEENVQWFKNILADLEYSDEYVDWEEAADFTNELEVSLWNLQCMNIDPVTGVELAAAFYRTDEKLFERCDDSGGDLGTVFPIITIFS